MHNSTVIHGLNVTNILQVITVSSYPPCKLTLDAFCQGHEFQSRKTFQDTVHVNHLSLKLEGTTDADSCCRQENKIYWMLNVNKSTATHVFVICINEFNTRHHKSSRENETYIMDPRGSRLHSQCHAPPYALINS